MISTRNELPLADFTFFKEQWKVIIPLGDTPFKQGGNTIQIMVDIDSHFCGLMYSAVSSFLNWHFECVWYIDKNWSDEQSTIN